MIDWLGIDHLFKLSGGEVVLGFLTPLFACAAVFVAHMILPARRVPGYATDRETGEPRKYRLNGLAVFVLAHIVWAFALPRDWFYRSTMYAIAGGVVIAIIANTIVVFSQPEGAQKNRLLAWWFGRAQEMQFFNIRPRQARPERVGGMFLCAFRQLALPGSYPAPCPAEPGLSSMPPGSCRATPRPPGGLARSTVSRS